MCLSCVVNCVTSLDRILKHFCPHLHYFQKALIEVTRVFKGVLKKLTNQQDFYTINWDTLENRLVISVAFEESRGESKPFLNTG